MKFVDTNIYVCASRWYGVVYKYDNDTHFVVVTEHGVLYKVIGGFVHSGKLYSTFVESGIVSRLDAWYRILEYLNGHVLVGTCFSHEDILSSDEFFEFRKFLDLEDKKKK